jgi:hypothetical protein
MITAGDPLTRTRVKFVMTNDSIELTAGGGPAQSALKISSAGIEIKSGATASTTWSRTGIDMTSAENKLKISLAKLDQQTIMLKENTDAVAEIKRLLANLNTDSIENLSAVLRSLKN